MARSPEYKLARFGASYQCDAKTNDGHQCQRYCIGGKYKRVYPTKPYFCRMHQNRDRNSSSKVELHPQSYVVEMRAKEPQS